MINTTLGNSSFCDKLLHSDTTLTPNLASLIVRLPVSIYILQLIISKRLITSEFYTLNGVIFDVFIYLYDILGLVIYICPNVYLMTIRKFFVGVLITGRPCLLTLICVERYLAVVKPVVFLELKPPKCRLALSGIIWLGTLVSCSSSICIDSGFHYYVIVQMTVCCMMKLYCCVATLLALKRPGPGEGLRQREGMSNIKLKAFRIILTITVSVIMMYVPLMVVLSLKKYLTQQQFLDVLNVCYTCTILSEFAQAFLFLQRMGKLPFIKWP